jgi:HEAT repeat protein
LLNQLADAVRARLEDDDADVRYEAVRAWDQLRRPDDSPPTEALARLLGDVCPPVRLVTARLVGRLGRHVLCASIINGLAALLHPDQAAVRGRRDRGDVIDCRSAALVAVGQLGPPAATSFVNDRVIECLFADTRGTTEQACRTIEQLGPAASAHLVETFAAMLRAPDRKTRDRCVQPMIRVGPQLCQLCGSSFLKELLRLLHNPDAGVRAATAAALEWLGTHAATCALLDRLEELKDDPDGYVRDAASNALQRLRPERA